MYHLEQNLSAIPLSSGSSLLASSQKALNQHYLALCVAAFSLPAVTDPQKFYFCFIE